MAIRQETVEVAPSLTMGAPHRLALTRPGEQAAVREITTADLTTRVATEDDEVHQHYQSLNLEDTPSQNTCSITSAATPATRPRLPDLDATSSQGGFSPVGIQPLSTSTASSRSPFLGSPKGFSLVSDAATASDTISSFVSASLALLEEEENNDRTAITRDATTMPSECQVALHVWHRMRLDCFSECEARGRKHVEEWMSESESSIHLQARDGRFLIAVRKDERVARESELNDYLRDVAVLDEWHRASTAHKEELKRIAIQDEALARHRVTACAAQDWSLMIDSHVGVLRESLERSEYHLRDIVALGENERLRKILEALRDERRDISRGRAVIGTPTLSRCLGVSRRALSMEPPSLHRTPIATDDPNNRRGVLLATPPGDGAAAGWGEIRSWTSPNPPQWYRRPPVVRTPQFSVAHTPERPYHGRTIVELDF